MLTINEQAHRILEVSLSSLRPSADEEVQTAVPQALELVLVSPQTCFTDDKIVAVRLVGLPCAQACHGFALPRAVAHEAHGLALALMHGEHAAQLGR